MCYSAEASFTAAALLVGIGGVGYVKANNRPHRLLAIFPFLFGVQQFIEGFVWISISYKEFYWFLNASVFGFLIFAWVVWPLFIPVTMAVLEQNVRKKFAMRVLFLVGVFVSATLLYILIFKDVTAEIYDCSIAYNFEIYNPFPLAFGILYIACTIIPVLISSVSKIWIIGFINLLSYFVSRIYFEGHVISVWCFFSAIASMLVLWIILDLNKNYSNTLSTR